TSHHDARLLPPELILPPLMVMVTLTRRVSPRDAVLTLATTALALQSTRHIVLFVAAATPLWIEQAHLVGRRTPARRPRPGPAATAPASPQRPPLPARVLAWSVLGGLTATVLLSL